MGVNEVSRGGRFYLFLGVENIRIEKNFCLSRSQICWVLGNEKKKNFTAENFKRQYRIYFFPFTLAFFVKINKLFYIQEPNLSQHEFLDLQHNDSGYTLT